MIYTFFFCLEALTGLGAENISSSSSSVKPTVSTQKKYQITVSNASQNTNTRMYFQPILPYAIGVQKRLMKDVQEMTKIFMETPFARVVVSRHSAGYRD